MQDLRGLVDFLDVSFGQKLLIVLVHRVIVYLSVVELHYMVFASLFSCYDLFLPLGIVTEIDQGVLCYSVTLSG